MAVKIAEQYKDGVKTIQSQMKLTGEKNGGKKFRINQEHFKEFLRGQGITDDTITQVAHSMSLWNDTVACTEADILQQNPDDSQVTINTYSPFGTMSSRMTREVETRIPGTGEKIIKNAVVSLKVDFRSRMNKELLVELAEELKSANK